MLFSSGFTFIFLSDCQRKICLSQVLMLDGNSELVAYVNRNICYLICLRHLIRSREVTNGIFSSEKTNCPEYVRNMI